MYQSKWQLFSSACLHSDSLCPSLERGRMFSGEEGCVSSFEVDVDGLGESVDVSGVHCYFRKLLQPQDR
jgi:hypothetical protein